MKLRCGLVLLALLLGTGCARTELPTARQMAPLPAEMICRVAVLPFLNDSKFRAGDAIVAKVFSARLQETGNYLVAQDGDVFKAYRQLALLPGTAPSSEQFQIIADRVNAQVLITGIVVEMREDRGEHGSVNPLVVLEVQIRDGRSGEVLWTSFHRRRGTDYQKTMHFGTIYTVTGLIRQMTDEILTLWLKKGLSRCNV
jgi:polysaccharide biosynthesis protein PelC